MTAARTFFGIDGCRAGWFCVQLDEHVHGSWCVLPDARAVGELAAGSDSALIDIPIGLVDAGPDGRQCDREARWLLGRGRAASVFAAPARSTLAAASYAQALELNRQATGRGLSIQAWCIVPKIRDIDTLLRENHRLQGLLRECHPELCWWALNGKRPMRYNKKQREGQQERLAVLGRYFPACRLLFEQVSRAVQRRHVAHDDIIDAMVCAVTANYGIDRFRTVPARPPVDGQGLPMEMVYCEGSRPRQK